MSESSALTRPVAVSVTTFPQHDAMVLGLRLRYVDVGPTNPFVGAADDRPLPLVIIPGHTARIEGFDEMLPTLAADHRVIVLDFPGSGYSDKPDRRYTVPFYEDVLAAFLDELGVGSAVPVGGSLGGHMVLRLGHRWPERFPTLVLWAPGGAWKAKPLIGRITSRLGRIPFWPIVRIQSRFWYSEDFPGRQQALDETFAYYREIMCTGFIRMYWGIAGDQVGHSLFDIAPQIHQRTLLMWGDQDNGGGMGAGVARLHELLPDNTFHVFAGARHSLEAEIPLELAETICRFLDETPAP